MAAILILIALASAAGYLFLYWRCDAGFSPAAIAAWMTAAISGSIGLGLLVAPEAPVWATLGLGLLVGTAWLAFVVGVTRPPTT